MINVLKNIIEIRKKKGISQEYIASQLDMKHSGYNLIENGKRELKFNTLLHIAKALDENVIDIISFPNKMISANSTNKSEPIEAILQIKLQSDKKDQVLKLVFGENNLEIFNK